VSVDRPQILILGGGILGSSVAWHLSRGASGEITVIDLDLAGNFSSSELNAGGCRATWWHPLNVELSQFSINFYKDIADEIQFFQKGYLFLYNQTKWKIAQEKKPLYERFKVPVSYLEPQEISKHLPEFKNLKGISGGTYSPQDGLLDPHLLKEYYRQGAKDRGVHFVDRVYVQDMGLRGKKVQSVKALRNTSPSLSDDITQQILTQHRVETGGKWSEVSFEPKIVINCTGAWLPITSQQYKRPLPVQPVRRQISLFSTHDEDLSDRGMMVDSSGLYMHPEGLHTGLVLAGYSNRDEKPGYRFDYDGEGFFDRKIWLRLYRRGGGQHFGALHHVRGWSGLYAVPPDNTGILWRVEGLENLYELGAATGRGVMQSYALGLALAELVLKERFETLDASPLTGKRFQTGNLLYENLDI